MKIALIYPNNNRSDYKPNTIYEPTSLLGMYNILKTKYDTYFFDAQKNNYSIQDMIYQLAEVKPDWLLFSVFETNEILQFISQVIENYKIINPDIKIMVGGPGVTYNCEMICDYLVPDVAVVGEGESLITDLVLNNFNLQKLIEKYNPNFLNNTLIIKGEAMPDIDNIPYERDYDMVDYNYQAMPNIQRGCIGNCVYCTGCGFQPVRYKSPEQVFKELDYLLKEKKVTKIMPFGPDFTVKPNNANKIIEYLVTNKIKDVDFIFVVRLDTLYKSLMLNPQIWSKFLKLNKVTFQIGVETFNANKLIRLGKYASIKNQLAHQQFEILSYLLDNYRAVFQCFSILLDPESNKSEIENDIEKMRYLLIKYPTKFQITGKLLNYLEIYSKTKSEIMYDRDWYLQSDTLIKKIYEVMELMNASKLYSKNNPVSEADYRERANDQFEILNVFQKRIND